MPIAVDLGALLLAGLALLLGEAAWILLNAIAEKLPNIHIAFVHIPLKSWFESAANTAGNAAFWAGKAVMWDLSQMLHAWAWMQSTIVGGIMDVLRHHGDLFALLHNETIPHSATDTRNQAKAYTDGQITTVNQAIAKASSDMSQALTKADRQIYKDIAGDVSTIDANIRKAVSTALDTAESYTDTAKNAAEGAAATALLTAQNALIGDINTLATTLGGQIATLTSTLTSDVSSLTSTITNDLATAEQYTRDQVHLAEKAASDAVAAAKVQEQTDIGTVNTTIAQDLTTAKAYADTQVANAKVADAKALNADVGTIEGGVLGALGSIAGDLIPNAQLLNGDFSTLAPALGAAIGAAVAGVAARVAKLESCSVGVCPTSPNNFGTLLNEALGVVDSASALALVGTMVTQPASAAAAYSDAIGGLFSGGEDLLNLMLSI